MNAGRLIRETCADFGGSAGGHGSMAGARLPWPAPGQQRARFARSGAHASRRPSASRASAASRCCPTSRDLLGLQRRSAPAPAGSRAPAAPPCAEAWGNPSVGARAGARARARLDAARSPRRGAAPGVVEPGRSSSPARAAKQRPWRVDRRLARPRRQPAEEDRQHHGSSTPACSARSTGSRRWARRSSGCPPAERRSPRGRSVSERAWPTTSSSAR